MTFPGASKTFSIIRGNQTEQQGNNIVPAAPATIATGVSIWLRDLDGVLDAERSGVTLDGTYRGATFASSDIRVGDVLQDETENDRNGDPVQYQVLQTTFYVVYLKLHLRRTQIPS